MPSIPPKPARFAPDAAPVGVEVKFINFLADRPTMRNPPRLQLVHTNAALREGTVESAWNWAHAAPNSNTIPHYQIDRSGRARKMLPSNRVGIANGTVDEYQGAEGDVRNWSLAYETADRGSLHPDGLGGFTPEQGEVVATILAYEAMVSGIPLSYPTRWDGAGSAAHTEPFGYPYWTTQRGKTCPGADKKRDLREWVLPRARQIAAAWIAPPDPDPVPPAPPEEDDMAVTFIAVNKSTGGTAMVSHDGAGVTFTWVQDRAPYAAGGMKVYEVAKQDFEQFAAGVVKKTDVEVINATTDDPFRADVKLL